MARLTEEIGELAREVNHYHGEKPKKTSEKTHTVEEELGDILFVLACFANSLDIDLSESFHMAISKIETRDNINGIYVSRLMRKILLSPM